MGVYQEAQGDVKEKAFVLEHETLEGMARAGLLNLAVQLGLNVVQQMLAHDVERHAGKKGKHDPNRRAYRHGSEQSKVVMGDHKVTISRPRVRSKDGQELPLPTLALFQSGDPLTEAVMARVLNGVSTRKYARTLGSDGTEASCVSKSEVSRRFIAGMEQAMKEFLTRRIDELADAFVAVMLDGLVLGGMTVVVALGITTDGTKHILGMLEGGTENSEVVKALLSDLIDRGLNATEPRMIILDGSKALHKAVTDTFGKAAVIQRCQVHKKRNVLSLLPESEKNNISLALSAAYLEFDYDPAKAKLEEIAKNLEKRYPRAAASLREGLDETLTVHRLQVPGLLRATLSNTNALESANSSCVGIIRRVTNFKDGAMVLRHAAAGFMEAERGFRRVKGFREIPLLIDELRRVTGIQYSVDEAETAPPT